MSTPKPSPTWPTRADIDRSKIAARRRESAASSPMITDTDRIDALITLFGGHYAFPAMWQLSDLFGNGRDGLDAFLASNPSLVRGLARDSDSENLQWKG